MSQYLFRFSLLLFLLYVFPVFASGNIAGSADSSDDKVVWQVSEDEAVFTAGSPGPYEPGLLLLLSGMDKDPGMDELKAYEPGLKGKLISVALDESVLSVARYRAVAALGYLSSDDAFSTVVDLIGDDTALDRIRLAAIWTLGHRFLDRPGREEILADVLKHEDHGFRLHSVLSLAAIGSPSAFKIIDAHRISERHLAVRSVLRDLKDERSGMTLDHPREGLNSPRLHIQHRSVPVHRIQMDLDKGEAR